MAFVYERTIRFQETDAAGVIYFSNVLVLCHEAYEASLESVGMDLRAFFSPSGQLSGKGVSADAGQRDGVAVPIVHAEVDFFQPLFCGDAIAIMLTPRQLGPDSFEIVYLLTPVATVNSEEARSEDVPAAKPLAKALTRHVCIKTDVRRRRPLTAELLGWLADLAEPE